MNRRPNLDWLRVIAFALPTLPLNSPESLPWLTKAMRFTNRWRIPLISIVSGGAIVLALGQRPPGVFACDRVRRLLLPLVFGILVIVPARSISSGTPPGCSPARSSNGCRRRTSASIRAAA